MSNGTGGVPMRAGRVGWCATRQHATYWWRSLSTKKLLKCGYRERILSSRFEKRSPPRVGSVRGAVGRLVRGVGQGDGGDSSGPRSGEGNCSQAVWYVSSNGQGTYSSPVKKTGLSGNTSPTATGST